MKANMKSKSRITRLLQKAYKIPFEAETEAILGLISRHTDRNAKIADIGCGNGRILRKLASRGYKNFIGYDVDERSVKSLQADGFRAESINAAWSSRNEFDVIVLSHIIEHFQPVDLIDFFNNIEQISSINAIIIIATPTPNDQFFEDFDHIRPYLPASIAMVCSRTDSQTKLKCRLQMQPLEVMLRRQPHRLAVKPLSRSGKTPYLYLAADLFLFMMYIVSFGIFSKTTGWMGAYHKTQVNGD